MWTFSAARTAKLHDVIMRLLSNYRNLVLKMQVFTIEFW
jgi:hypothetical protein